jgi:hypothetical protein
MQNAECKKPIPEDFAMEFRGAPPQLKGLERCGCKNPFGSNCHGQSNPPNYLK